MSWVVCCPRRGIVLLCCCTQQACEGLMASRLRPRHRFVLLYEYCCTQQECESLMASRLRPSVTMIMRTPFHLPSPQVELPAAAGAIIFDFFRHSSLVLSAAVLEQIAYRYIQSNNNTLARHYRTISPSRTAAQ